ncbi:hypothetical protein [Kitasatospora azatica]|uniref:hypothetical protein n=1 Tax=Kitasatospora azatica TaxID=58347 RepID=UPI00068CBD3E|nr:hypothetical protein [Kitasatospora azatica]
MTEQKRPFGDDGPGDTPLELLLREALAARAGQVTANDLRPEAPPARRVRRIRPLYTVALPLVGLAAAASIGYLGFQGSPVAKHETPAPAASVDVTPTPAPAPTPSTAAPSASAGIDPAAVGESPSGTTTGRSSAPAVAPYSWNGISFPVPAGWTVEQQGPTMLCALPPSGKTLPAGFDCEPYGVRIAAYNTPEQVHNATWPNRYDVWYKNADQHQPACYDWDSPRAGGAQTLQQYSFSAAVLAQLPVDEATWQLACDGGGKFTARRWSFGPQEVFISAMGLSADYEPDLQSLLSGLDMTLRQNPLSGTTERNVAITFDGLTRGEQIPAGSTVTFSVTWTNIGSVDYGTVLPAAAGEQFDGNGSTGTQPNPVLGTLERQDGTTWTKLPATIFGSAMDFAHTSQAAAFKLAPGEHHTVTYRLTLDPKNGTGTLPLHAAAYLPADGTASMATVGEAFFPVVIAAK